MNTVTLENIMSLCKRRGFVYQSAEIYGGINGVYDFGHLGVLMKQNIKNYWTKSITNFSDDILFFDGGLLGPESVWNASGHIENFNDPMVDCLNCKHRFRADEIDLNKACSNCGKKDWTNVRQFNLMFKTAVGAASDKSSTGYLRPETAQSIFINFKNIISTNRVKLPFGIAQIGKAFRNEITPKQFLFRSREFEQMELEWFCKSEDSKKYFDEWLKERESFYINLGINKNKIRLRPHANDELAHYSTCCSDVEYEFPFGWKELEGIAHRGNFDLTQHSKSSGKELAIRDEEDNNNIIPDVIECSVGVDRLFLMLMFDSYAEEEVNGEVRTVLKLNPKIAPIKAAFLPLTNKLDELAYKEYKELKTKCDFTLQYDKSGSIGKRYRRQDEIGTPLCFTFDFDSVNDGSVTARNRDTLEQERIKIEDIPNYIFKFINK
jgi:glycyl-tRNA synthetase